MQFIQHTYYTVGDTGCVMCAASLDSKREFLRRHVIGHPLIQIQIGPNECDRDLMLKAALGLADGAVPVAAPVVSCVANSELNRPSVSSSIRK